MLVRLLLTSAVPWILFLFLPACSIKVQQAGPGEPPPSPPGRAGGLSELLRARGSDAAPHGDEEQFGNLKYDKAARYRRVRPVTVIVDTDLGFDQFDDVRNYRALESLLASHPGAEVQFLRIASDVSAMGYQYGNSLPFNILQKHAAMGYPVRVRQINGEQQSSQLGMQPGSPGLEWWNKYGVGLARRRPGEWTTNYSPEVSDRTARFAARLILLQQAISQSNFTIVSDLTVVLQSPARVGFWELQANETGGGRPASHQVGLASPALMVASEKERDAVRCALSAFDGAARRHQRDPNDKEVRACLGTASLGSSPGLGVATSSAPPELLAAIKRRVRENAPDKEFVQRWKRSSGTRPEDSPLVNPYVLDAKARVSDRGRAVAAAGSSGTVNASARKSCPAVVVPGFPRAGTTAFYAMLMEHPMVLSQLRGPHGFSEGNHYWEPELRRRYMWTPMIEQDEPFVWFDVGPFYGVGSHFSARQEDDVLEVMKRDCVKTPSVLWLLRDPVSLMISTFRFFGGVSAHGTFDQYMDVVRASESSPPEAEEAPYSLGRMDRVLEQPVYWRDKLGAEDLNVVNIEEWSDDPGPSLREAFRLMGLPEDELGRADDIPEKNLMGNPQKLTVCQSNIEWLQDHFRPKKQALMREVGRLLTGWGAVRMPHGVTMDLGC